MVGMRAQESYLHPTHQNTPHGAREVMQRDKQPFEAVRPPLAGPTPHAAPTPRDHDIKLGTPVLCKLLGIGVLS